MFFRSKRSHPHSVDQYDEHRQYFFSGWFTFCLLKMLMGTLFVFQMMFEMSATVSGVRILLIFEKHEMIRPKFRKILVVSLLTANFSLIFLNLTVPIFVIGTIFIFLCALFAIWMMIQRDRARLDRSILYFLDLIILQMKTGAALRESIKSVIASETRPEVKTLQQILDRLEFNLVQAGPSNAHFESLFREIKSLETYPFKTIERLESFRQRIQKELHYRQKSSQVGLQTRAQAVVISFLFVGVLVFVGQRFGFQQNWQLFLISTCLFAAGLLWIWRIGRKIRWKI